MMRNRRRPEPYELYAANGSRITTYGFVTLQPDLGLRRAFPWRFVVANVRQPIIGSNFLTYYDLMPDMRRSRLKDVQTGLLTTGSRCYQQATSIKAILETAGFHKIVTEFPNIIKPGKATENARHNTASYPDNAWTTRSQ